MRLDKYLKVSRLIKRRTVANEACDNGLVLVNGKAARASYEEGAARNSWLTGTASWTFVNISQYILGIKPTLKGLSVVPCLPKELDEYTVDRRYRGAMYHIHVKQTGEAGMSVDGVKVAGNVIPDTGKKEYLVEVTV